MNVFALLSKEESIVILDNVKQNCLIGIAMGFQSKQCVILQTIGTQ
jgi:hypothetical protein